MNNVQNPPPPAQRVRCELCAAEIDPGDTTCTPGCRNYRATPFPLNQERRSRAELAAALFMLGDIIRTNCPRPMELLRMFGKVTRQSMTYFDRLDAGEVAARAELARRPVDLPENLETSSESIRACAGEWLYIARMLGAARMPWASPAQREAIEQASADMARLALNLERVFGAS